jgi:hypothetical protein
MLRRVARLKPKKVKGRIATLTVLPYRGNMVYIRMIDKDIFEYLAVYKGEIYSSYMIITPKKGSTSLTKSEISQCAKLLWAGAEATLNVKMNIKLDKKKAEVVEVFEGSRKSVEKILPN